MRVGNASVGRYATIVVAPLAVAYGVIAVGVATRHGTFTTYAGRSTAAAAVELTAGWTLVAAGLVAWWRRPRVPAGPLAVLAGFAWFTPDWIGWQTGPAAVRALALAGQGLTLAAVVQLALGAPTGWPSSVLARRLIITTWSATVVIAIGRVLFYNPFTDPACVTWCTANPLLLHDSQTVARGLDWADVGLCALVAVGLAGAGGRSLAQATTAARRMLAPVVVPAALFVAAWTLRAIVVAATPDENPARAILIASFAGRAVGLGLMALGLAWSMGRAARGANMLRRLARDAAAGAGGDPLEVALARATGDMSLRLAFPLRDGGGWIDAQGAEIEPPQRRADRSVTTIDRDGQTGRRAAARSHDSRRRGAATRDRHGRRAGDRQRATPRGGAGPASRAEGLTPAACRSRRCRASDARARPSRRCAAAAREPRDRAANGTERVRRAGCRAPLGRRCARPASGWSARSPSFANWPTAFIRLSSATKGSRPRSRRWPTARRCSSALFPSQRLPPSVEVAAYVLVEEAVRRAATRAHGPAPGVHARVADGKLVVEVEDPGEASPQRTLANLVSVVDRVRALDGLLTVEPTWAGDHLQYPGLVTYFVQF